MLTFWKVKQLLPPAVRYYTMGDVAMITCEMQPDCLLSYDAQFQFQVFVGVLLWKAC